MSVAVPTFREVYERTGPIHHNEKMPKEEKVQALTKELVSSGFLLNKNYRSIPLGKYFLYAFEIGERDADILLLHDREAMKDREFAFRYGELLNDLANKELNAPAWDFPEEVISYIIQNNHAAGQLET